MKRNVNRKNVVDSKCIQLLEGFGATELIEASYYRHRFPLHYHNTFVIELIINGVDWCSDCDLVATKGQLFVHFPFAAHTGGTVDRGRLKYLAIYPSVELIAELTNVPTAELETGQTLVIDEPNVLRESAKFFRQLRDQTPSRKNFSKLKQIFDAIMSLSADTEASRRQRNGRSEGMLKIRNFLTANFDRDVTNKELSDQFGLSQFHLIRQFKRTFGITPRQFLISKRVIESKKLLAAGRSVAETAYTTGFADQSHLSRQFKRINGYSPGKFARIG